MVFSDILRSKVLRKVLRKVCFAFLTVPTEDNFCVCSLSEDKESYCSSWPLLGSCLKQRPRESPYQPHHQTNSRTRMASLGCFVATDISWIPVDITVTFTIFKFFFFLYSNIKFLFFCLLHHSLCQSTLHCKCTKNTCTSGC